ncbi:MAG: sialate O-acetylesterase [Lentisphaeria bacterium]|nr:sialate O-acetylesterase [Lentisphaeria bacterium]
MKRIILLSAMLVALQLSAKVSLPGIFSDHAVLAKKAVVPVFGKADPGEKVVVKFNSQKKETVAGKDGKWRVNLDLANSPEGPFELKINDIVIKDVIVGEVWLCSGQSNMQYSLAGSIGRKEECAKPVGSRFRCFNVKRNSSKVPLEEMSGKWVYAGSVTSASFPGVGYFFGKKLLNELNRPVGLINASWGGTDITAWISWEAISKNKAALARSKAKDRANLPKRERVKPTRLYNAMIFPLAPYALNGTLWYQGERNARNAHEYADLTRAMVALWRKNFEFAEMPFYWCSLAAYQAKNPDPNAKSNWAALREQQTLALDVPFTGQAILTDAGEARNIHPRDKKTPGERLAAIALANVYGKKVPFAGPMMTGVVRKGNKLVVSFKDVDGGLVARPLPAEYDVDSRSKAKVKKSKLVRNSPAAQVEGFAVCGKDGKYFWADEAVISGDTVIVSSKNVAEPCGIRFAWAQNPTANLYNKAGFPAVPFQKIIK